MKTIKQVTIVLAIFLSLASVAKAQTATINWNDVRQQIDGFGASSAFTGRNLTSGQADLFFSTTNGIGLSLLRTRVPTDGTFGETATMQQAIARGARVWSSPWSPPAAMKTNGKTTNGGSLLTSSYQAYADYLSNYVRTLKSQYGVDLYAISVQNEPDWVANWDTCSWTGQQLHDFIASNLSPTFTRDGVRAKIILPEQAGWAFDLANETMSDPASASAVGIIAAHNYDSGGAYPVAQAQDKGLWETEVSTFGPFDPSMSDALFWSQKIHDWMTVANASAWHYWWLVSNKGDNEALIDNGVVSKRLYAMGNFSKFVRPGYYRIGATTNPTGGVSISAYKDPSSGNFAIIAINQNASDVPMNFVLGGFTAASVTPWVTSANLNLFQQSTFTVAGSSFSATLPAASVTTFVSSGQLQTLTPTPTPSPSPSPTTDTLTLNLSEDAYQGDAQFSATIDGAFLTTSTAVTALHGSGQNQAFTFTGNWGVGRHTIVITFLNDAYGGTPQTDRNLYADSISYDGLVSSSQQELLRTGDTATFTTNVTTPPPILIPSPSPTTDTLTLNLSEDAYQGDAQFSATIDGAFLTTSTAVTALHGSGQNQAFTFTGNWGVGRHTIVITFLNDAYGGTPQTDRNLYADSISYDGALYASLQTLLRVGDTATFTTN